MDQLLTLVVLWTFCYLFYFLVRAGEGVEEESVIDHVYSIWDFNFPSYLFQFVMAILWFWALRAWVLLSICYVIKLHILNIKCKRLVANIYFIMEINYSSVLWCLDMHRLLLVKIRNPLTKKVQKLSEESFVFAIFSPSVVHYSLWVPCSSRSKLANISSQ